jgi:hypothetical protein
VQAARKKKKKREYRRIAKRWKPLRDGAKKRTRAATVGGKEKTRNRSLEVVRRGWAARQHREHQVEQYGTAPRGKRETTDEEPDNRASLISALAAVKDWKRPRR